MNDFLLELKETLDKVLIWSDNFRKGDKDYDFDVDDELYLISKKFHKNFQQGDLALIYNLLDFYCDAVKHGFKQIDKNYLITEVSDDIKSISLILARNSCSSLELPEALKKRMEGI